MSKNVEEFWKEWWERESKNHFGISSHGEFARAFARAYYLQAIDEKKLRGIAEMIHKEVSAFRIAFPETAIKSIEAILARELRK